MFGSLLLTFGKEKRMCNTEFEYFVTYPTPLNTDTDDNS